MHSTGMRTARLLTISQHALGREGVSAGGGVLSTRRGVGDVCQGVLPRGVCQGGVYPSMQWGRHPSLRTDRHL